MTLRYVLSDCWVVAQRNLVKVKRVPDLLVFTTLSPIMFVLLFAYVFSGAIGGQAGSAAYREFLIAGIFAQTVVFGATITGAALATDVREGIIDRFRSLPMSRGAVLAGRTLADVANNVLVLLVMSLTGLVVGWRIHASPGEAALGYLLLLVFAYAVSWIMAWIGLLVPSPEVVNNAAFIVIFPITFISNAFVPLQTLPSGLRDIAEWNPVSTATQAARELFGNLNPLNPGNAQPSWALAHPEVYTLLWAAAILLVFVPLANWQYRRSTSQ